MPATKAIGMCCPEGTGIPGLQASTDSSRGCHRAGSCVSRSRGCRSLSAAAVAPALGIPSECLLSSLMSVLSALRPHVSSRDVLSESPRCTQIRLGQSRRGGSACGSPELTLCLALSCPRSGTASSSSLGLVCLSGCWAFLGFPFHRLFCLRGHSPVLV